MPDSIGTRSQQTLRKEHVDQGSDTRSHTRDLGLSKNVTAATTFAAGTGRASAANGTFNNFAVNDQILIQGTNLNNGYKTVTGIDGVNHAYLVLDPAPKDEGPLSATIRIA